MNERVRKTDVTVVTVTYQAAHLIERCLLALRDQRLGHLKMQIVVVDNNSTDDTALIVDRSFPEVDLVRAPTNLGFAAGSNLGMARATSPWVILLNNDAVPEPDFVAAILAAGEASPPSTAAIAARVLLSQHFRAVDQVTPGAVRGQDGYRLPDDVGDLRLVNSTGNLVRRDGFGLDRGWLADAGTHHPDADVFGFSGAAALLRMSAVRTVGTFDERLFMYYEDTDLSWRMRRAGFDVRYCEQAIVHHDHSATTGEGSTFFHFHDARNRLVVLTKNASSRIVLTVVARYVLTTASLLLRSSGPMTKRLTTATWRTRALASWARLLPHALRERHRINVGARLSHREVESVLSPLGTGTDSAFRS